MRAGQLAEFSTFLIWVMHVPVKVHACMDKEMEQISRKCLQ